MIHTAKQQKRICLRLPMFLTALLLLTGCTPEEKTLLLSRSQPDTEAAESQDPAKDFTVKKIYAYTYTTRDLLMQSAFLEGCGENEIHIIAFDERDDDEKLVYRQVDYRYGFYDTMGEFFRFWEDWFEPANPNLMCDDLYISQLLPSPDGTQMLVYIRSTIWDTCFIWLCSLDSQDPWLLYEGIHIDDPLKGSFSPDGRWVTFDAAGTVTGGKHLVPIYDCRRNTFADREQYWTVTQSSDSYSGFYPPDELLYTEAEVDEQVLNAQLCSYSESPSPALLTFIHDSADDISVNLLYKIPGEGVEPDINASTGLRFGEKGRLYLLGKEFNETNPEDDLSMLELLDPNHIGHSMAYLFNYTGMPYIQFQYDNDNDLLYYMPDTLTLSVKNMNTLQDNYQPLTFSEPVWDFIPLASGDILALLIQTAGTMPVETQGTANTQNTYIGDSGATPYTTRNYWDIQSADLYLYPADGTERHLLYKNVQNLLNMEYDAQSRRILLETFEDDEMGHRRCIILEL